MTQTEVAVTGLVQQSKIVFTNMSILNVDSNNPAQFGEAIPGKDVAIWAGLARFAYEGFRVNDVGIVRIQDDLRWEKIDKMVVSASINSVGIDDGGGSIDRVEATDTGRVGTTARFVELVLHVRQWGDGANIQAASFHVTVTGNILRQHQQ